jgi:hypothetical protein
MYGWQPGAKSREITILDMLLPDCPGFTGYPEVIAPHNQFLVSRPYSIRERLRHLFSIDPISEAKSHGIVRLALLRVR